MGLRNIWRHFVTRGVPRECRRELRVVSNVKDVVARGLLGIVCRRGVLTRAAEQLISCNTIENISAGCIGAARIICHLADLDRGICSTKVCARVVCSGECSLVLGISHVGQGF